MAGPQLKPDPSAVGRGGGGHIPSFIMLGRHKGIEFNHSMPKLCRNCGELGHLAAACTVVKCKTCGGEHETRACCDPRPCNLCRVTPCHAPDHPHQPPLSQPDSTCRAQHKIFSVALILKTPTPVTQPLIITTVKPDPDPPQTPPAHHDGNVRLLHN